MGLLDLMANDIIGELRQAFADLLAEQKKTNELLAQLIHEVKENG